MTTHTGSRPTTAGTRLTLWILGAAWFLLFLWGVWGLWARITTGHELADYGSYIVWGLWVSAYIYFIGLSAGAFLLSSLVYVGNVKKLEKVGKIALFTAVVTLFMALLAIWFDLGHMGRFTKVYTQPNFSSMMAWMVWLYTAYFILLIVELWFAMRPDMARWGTSHSGWKYTFGRIVLFGRTESKPQRDRKVLRVLGTIGIPLAIAFHGGVGALFGTVIARPYWNTPLVPVLFLTGALVSGGALMMAIVAVLWPKRDPDYQSMLSLLSKIVLGLVLFDIILEWAEFSIPLWYGIGPEVELLKQVLFGQYWWLFWLLHIGLGVVVPIILLVWVKRPWAIASAGALIAVTFMTVRLNIVVPGLVTPELEGIQDAFVDNRLTFSYTPSMFEWAVLAFIVTVGVAAFVAGVRLLPLIGQTRDREDTNVGSGV